MPGYACPNQISCLKSSGHLSSRRKAFSLGLKDVVEGKAVEGKVEKDLVLPRIWLI